MRARLGTSFLAVFTVLSLAVACSSSHAPNTGPVLKGPEIIIPQDLVDLITSLTLSVYPQTSEAGVMLSCDDSTGIVSGDVSSVTANPVFSDFTQSCGAAGGYCMPDGGSLTITQSATPKIFSVIGYDSSTQTDANKVAVGCTTQKIQNETSANISITLHHFLQPATCGDMTIEPPETCDDTTAVCPTSGTSKCQTVEELISFGGNGSGTTYGSPNQMTNPFFLWPSGTDPVSDAFMAFYTDASLAPANPIQVTARFMDFTLSPPSRFYMVANQSSIFLPDSATVPQPPSTTADLKEPSATVLGSNVYVAFASDRPVGSAQNPFNIFYDSVNLSVSLAGQGPCLVSTAQGGHVLAYPSIAASGNALYVVWTDENGNVNGALVSAPGSGCVTAGTATVLGSGISATANVGPKVAAAENGGWVVVWPSSSIQMQLIGSTGAPTGSATSVGSGSNPEVASLPSGAFAVAWNAGSNIEVQRYSSTGMAIDVSANVNATAGSAATPAIAGGTTRSNEGFYAVSWIAGTSPGTTVRARYLNATMGKLTDDSGYFFNPISGQLNDDFQVSLKTTAPANPTVAIGGVSGAYVAFGWEDHGTMCSSPSTFPGTPCYGILARRFPVPVE